MSESKERPAELRERTDEELKTLLLSLEQDLFKFRIQRFTNQLENTMKIRTTRRTMARVRTILTARAQGLETRTTAAAAEQQGQE
jgi:large subunit ribosomal protein L29